jgi:hypothetical protein
MTSFALAISLAGLWLDHSGATKASVPVGPYHLYGLACTFQLDYDLNTLAVNSTNK